MLIVSNVTNGYNHATTQRDRVMIKTGDQLRIKPEWQDTCDESITFVAIDDEDCGRVTIRAMLGLPINPTQVVRVDMVELIGGAS